MCKPLEEARRSLDRYLKVVARHDKTIARAKRRNQSVDQLYATKVRMLEELAQRKRDVIWAEDRVRFDARPLQAAE